MQLRGPTSLALGLVLCIECEPTFASWLDDLFSPQTITIRGAISCREDPNDVATPVHANGVLVIPAPYLTDSDLSGPNGQFRLPIPGAAEDQIIQLHCRNASADICSGKQDKENQIELTRPYIENGTYTLKDPIVTDIPCKDATSDPQLMKEQLRLFRESPDKAEKLLSIPELGAVGLTAAAAALTVGSASVGAGPGQTTPTPVHSISPGQFQAGRLAAYAMSAFSNNLGFNITPERNIAPAIFWNPSAAATSLFNQAEVSATMQGLYSVSGFVRLNSLIGLGAGYLTFRPDETRTGALQSGSMISDRFLPQEDEVLLAGTANLTNNVALGIAAKWLHQRRDAPSNVANADPNTGAFVSWQHDQRARNVADLDLSATYLVNAHITLGLALMDLAGATLTDDSGQAVKQRAVGLGTRYQWSTVQLGTDLFWREGVGTDAAFGVSVVPFTRALVQSGYDTTYHTYTSRVQYRFLYYAFNRSGETGNTHTLGLTLKW